VTRSGSPRVDAKRTLAALAFGLTLALALASLASLTACSRQAAPVDEAALRKEDRAALERVILLDVRASQAMKSADEAAIKGDAGAATDAVDKRALPALDEAIRTAEGAQMKTPWGVERRDGLLAVLRARKAEMPRYEEAVKSGDPEKMLGAVEAQAAIERRALGAVAAVQDER
jgi:hypothetical protein